jgi:CheY-like chemotaxis protein
VSDPHPAPVILLIEDAEPDAQLITTALVELGDQLNVFRVENADLALRFFFKAAEYSATPRADLVILDINLPGKSGYDLLEIMQGDAGLRGIPVVVFSTAARPSDKEKSLSLGAMAHIPKPWTYTGYENAVRKMVGMIPKGRSNSQGA